MHRMFRRKPFIVLGLPLAVATLTVGLLFGALFLSAATSDEAANQRQQGLLKLVVTKLEAEVAHNQESATVWDDAVVEVRQRNKDWIASNLGEWMHSYFQHDAALVLDNTGNPIYEFVAEPSASVSGATIAKIAAPLVSKLQKRLAAGEISAGTTILSIGESDLLDLNGRAAIFSLKPIITDSGEIEQEPGSQNLHLAVRYLDGVLLSGLAQDYQFQDLAFVRKPTDGAVNSSVALRSASGHTIGYFQWQPFSPGASVIQAVSPVIVVVGLSAFLLMSFLGHAIWRRSTSLAESQQELRHLAMHDPLTGLANRTTFHCALVQSLGSATAERDIAVMFVDLDHFKEVNDSFGHPVGDMLIKEVSNRLKEIAPSALVCRVGGDEFTLLVPAEALRTIDRLAEEIIDRLRMPFQIEGSLITVGASIGISLFSPGVDATEMIRRADIALYHAKAAGRSTFAVFGTHMEEILRRRRVLESDLATALETGTQLAVHYQPVYSAIDGRMSSMEALCRWMHPTFGTISPDVFVPIAEECGLIQKLGLYVLEEACSLLADVPDCEVGVSVNASAIELMAPGYALRVLTMLSKFSLDPSRLEIEITERVATDAEGKAAAAIRSLRDAGVRFAIDDFGIGTSSFGQLLNLNVDRIKIDKMFVDQLHENGGAPLVEAIVQMARHKGLKTTAEGVETADQRVTLTSLGCDNLQGFQLSKPLSRPNTISLLSQQEQTRVSAVL
jgi:diguanylate cyclase (GGDEF)-like protein